MPNLLVRELYTESTLDESLAKLPALQAEEDADGLLCHVGLNKRTLMRTAQKGMEEYVDGLVALRHAWAPKMISGTPNERAEMYTILYGVIKQMDEFSEPYVSAMRIVSTVALSAYPTSYKYQSN